MSELIPYDHDSFERYDPPLIPAFTPVPRKSKRAHGWSPERQLAFIEALADCGSVTEAARRVNMTPEAAYYLRRAEGAESFRHAWEVPVEIGKRSLEDLAMDRVRQGNIVTKYENGEIVSEKRWHDNRLLMFMLRHHQPERYGRNGGLLPGGRSPFHVRTRSLEETRANILRKIEAIKRHRNRAHYAELSGDPAKRAAWELLNGKPLETLLGSEQDRIASPAPDPAD